MITRTSRRTLPKLGLVRFAIRVFCVGGLLPGCAKEPVERFPPASDRCAGKPCSGPGVSGGLSGSPRNPSSGAADAGATLTDGGKAQTLRGSVLAVRSADLSQTTKLSGFDVRVVAMGSREQATVFSGTPFALALTKLPSWLRVEAPESPKDAADWLTTLQAVGSTQLPVELLLMERQALSDVSEALELNPVALDPTRGHALLHFIGGDGEAVRDATVEVAAGLIAYDTGATFSDAVPATGGRGAVALFNAPASPAPGREFPVRVTSGAVTTTVQVPLVTDAVTLMLFELRDN